MRGAEDITVSQPNLSRAMEQRTHFMRIEDILCQVFNQAESQSMPDRFVNIFVPQFGKYSNEIYRSLN